MVAMLEFIIKYLFIYVIVWWIILFPLLSRGVEVPPKQEIKGADAGAPRVTHLKKKFWIATIAAAIITVPVYFIAQASFSHIFLQ